MRSVVERYRGRTVRVFRLDRERVVECLRAAARRIVEENAEVEEVWLFGSLARGDARPGSDADLLVLVRESAVPFLDRGVKYASYVRHAGVGCEIVAYTREELARLRNEGRRFWLVVASERIILASRR